MTEAVIKALEMRLEEMRLEDERRRRVEEREGLESRIKAPVGEMKDLPVVDDRREDEILYDEEGLPK